MAPPPRPSPSPAPTPGPSRRPPSKLRVPTSSRKASNPSLSLVYASPGSSLPPVPSSSSISRSEEALSRQLDADLGGKQMGLRSRRSSSATVRTINTLNGNGNSSGGQGPQSPRESIAEEDEGPILEREAGQRQRLNPKASSSWLRWNSPTPSFPRSIKGKEREGDVTPGRRPSTIGGVSIRRQASRRSEPPEEEAGPGQSQPSEASLLAGQPPKPMVVPPPEPVDPPDISGQPVEASLIPPPTPARSRGWFSRNPPPRTEPPGPAIACPIEPTAAPVSSATTTSIAVPVVSATDVADAQTQMPDVGSETSGPPAPATLAAQKGWIGYLSWGRGGTAPSVRQTGQSQLDEATRPAASTEERVDPAESLPVAQPDEPPAALESTPPAQLQSDTATGAEPPAEVLSRPESSHVAETTSLPAQNPSQTWGTFLYNIVIPQTRDPLPIDTARPPVEDQIVEPTSPTDDQRPIHVESELEPAPSPAPVQPVPNTTSEQLHVPSTDLNESRTGISPKARKGSQASTNGWLSYLAFRASQRKVQQPASVLTAGTEEEVMDFSNDPNFPSGPPAATDMPSDKSATGKVASNDPTASMKPPQTISMRNKRPSNSSLRSAASVTPIPPSPRKQSKGDTGTTTPVPSIKGGPSSLPPPPQQPSQQPNLVIPTFESTFNRPPRCFLPMQTPKSPRTPAQPPSGLAWRALGAVGSYVYTGTAQEVKKDEKVDGDPKETRGRKEGRNVGADLPRKLGLAEGDAEDGWKNVRRVVVVGVHGWFPAKMLNSVIGEPTGTSSKFANMMGQAVKRFFDDKGVEDIRLTMIPLEGEGTIEHRVDRLYKSYLSNPAWINDLRRADALFFAAHSQGCIVTTHLLSRLIAQGHIKTPLNAEAVARCSWAFGPVSIVPPPEPRTPRLRKADTVPVNVEEGGYQKVCMLAMCGVHQGPLYSLGTSTVIQPYLQWFENAAARELFEFQDTTSAVAQAYQRALAMVLENDVRVVLLSSLNDQVVPIYGSSFSAATHPLLLRALFVDGASYTQSDFMTNLLCFAFMLRNAGLSDEHLIEHLSEATAGSLTGLGHSTPYEEPATFRLAVDYLFHSGPAADPMPELKVDHFAAREGRNDFELPWIMRAIVDSPEVKDLFPGELRDLKEGILHWKPTTKALRDIKKRLEPMAGRQSKLRPLPQSPSSTSLNNAAELGASPNSNRNLAPPAGKSLKSKL